MFFSVYFKMADIFTLENIVDFSEKISIDDLYEKRKEHDLKKLELFNKILYRVHVRIKTTSRQKKDEQFCWFVVPETIIGVPKYDQGTCIAYIIDKLKDNGFKVNYIHPNTLFISWLHWVPSYVRDELKKKTGIQINEFGVKINVNEPTSVNSDYNLNKIDVNKSSTNPNNLLLNENKSEATIKLKKEYTPITSYKPSGNLINNNTFLHNKL
jgi:hypothetical protein